MTSAPAERASRPGAPAQAFRLVSYDEASATRQDAERFADLRLPEPDSATTTWLHVQDPDEATLRDVAAATGLHPVAIEDVLEGGERPKASDYGDHVVIVARRLHAGQLTLLLGERILVTFARGPHDPGEKIRESLVAGTSRARGRDADFLAYLLLDLLVDDYLSALEAYSDELAGLEDRVMTERDDDAFKRVTKVRHELLRIRSAAWPLREVMARLARMGPPLIGEETLPYLHDTENHVMQVLDTLEVLRELATSLHEAHLTVLNTRMNDIIKVLTIISTIFIPLTFLAGIYGMNFKNQPEYSWPWAYPALWGLMIVISALMLWYFRRKRWL